VLSHADPAAALTQAGSLGEPAADVDYYRATCSNDGSGEPASLVTQVLDAGPVAAPLLSVQSQKGLLATNTTDPVDGDANASAPTWLNGGAGSYDVFVDKSGAGVESYLLTVQCTTGANGGGVATGTALTPISIGPGPVPVPALSGAGALALPAGLAGLALAALRRRRAAAAIVLLAALALPQAARAHTQNGSLGSAATATDFYQVTCSDDGSGPPASLTLQVLDASPAAAPLVAVQAQKGTLATNSTDPVDADATASPLVVLDGGAGVYDVLVYKTDAGVESYTLTFHCLTGPGGTGDHTGTSIATRQNQ
jgi:hypothetical protein